MGVGSQLIQDVQQSLAVLGIPRAFFIGGDSIEELGTADSVHQSEHERIVVAGGGVGEQSDALSLSGLAQFPHLVPSGGNFPALVLEQLSVVEQATGRVEHGSHVGNAITVGSNNVVVGEAASDLFRNLNGLAGDGQGQSVGQGVQSVSLNQLLGQTSGTAGSQMDNIGEFAVLHGTGQDVLQVLVGGQLDLDAGLSFESSGNVNPDLRTVSGLDGSNLDGHRLSSGGISSGSVCLGSLGSGRSGRTAASDQRKSHGKAQQHSNDLLHLNILLN